MRHKILSKLRGFTLIELLVVIAIIGILASIIIVSLSAARAKGRDAKRIADIRNIQLALEQYYNDNQHYPCDIYINSGTPACLPSFAGTYMSVVPTDPSYNPSDATCVSTRSTSGCYFYTGMYYTPSTAGGIVNFYHLGTAMEDTTNTGLSQDNDLPGSSGNYGASNANAGSAMFDGNATKCVGTSAVSPDSCYDVTP